MATGSRARQDGEGRPRQPASVEPEPLTYQQAEGISEDDQDRAEAGIIEWLASLLEPTA